MNHLKIFWRFANYILLIIVFIVGGFSFYLVTHITNNLSITKYQVQTDKINRKIRIVHLSDLHGAVFGEDNDKLAAMVESQEPNLIFMTGDMLDDEEISMESFDLIVEKLSDIAPVYYGLGNHETWWELKYSKKLAKLLDSEKVTLLEREYVDIQIAGNDIRLGGYMGYYRFPGMLTRNKSVWESDNEFFEDFEDTDRLKVLINHIPTQWVDWHHNDDFDVDLVFSGHYHGGQWVLPVIGAVYVPYIGFNPPNTRGVFEGKKATCILSAGLGNEYGFIPRINNQPEIVVVDLVPTN